jgi:hypothetical protein
MRAYHSVLFVSGDRDAAGLSDAIAIAATFGAELTLAISVYDPPGLAQLTFVNIAELRDEIRQEAEQWAREALAMAPAEVSMSVVCVPAALEDALALEVACGLYDLCIVRQRRRWLVPRRRTFASRVTTVARRRNVPMLALPAR